MIGKRNKIILIGYRCTGKTSIGQRLARRLELPFLDTDLLVEKAVGKTIREMVAERGWAFFRTQERAAVKSLASLDACVVATGGGAVMDAENAAVLKEGVVVWLQADAGTIRERMEADFATGERRPPLGDGDLRKEIADTLALRTPVYQRLADCEVDTGKMDIRESVEKIVRFLETTQ